MSDNLIDLLRDAEPITEPPKRWRNKWSAAVPAPFITDGGGTIFKGPEWLGKGVFPTKDIAETKAMKLLSSYSAWAKVHGVRFLGAFPVEE